MIKLYNVRNSTIAMTPLLWLLGNDQDAANRSVLSEHGISHVINVTSHVPLHFQSDGVEYLRFPASDSGVQNLRQYFDEAINFIGLTV